MARESDEKSLVEKFEKSKKFSEMTSWIGLASLLLLTVGRYAFFRLFVGYAGSGLDLPVSAIGALGFAFTIAASSRGRRTQGLLELAIHLKRRARAAPAAAQPEDERQG